VKEVAGFELLSRLGEGGMGQVFKARQRSIDRLVALKVLTPKLAEDKDYVDRFEREAKAAGKLSHPNIVAVIDRGEDASGPKVIRWIAFEYIDGSSLESKIKKGRLPERDALKVVRDMAEALRYASEKGLIHRDVKPDNILLTAEGVPKLADLGLAKFQEEKANLTQTGIVMGTPHYMAPEQALGERDLDVRADVYALGLVFYRCLTGELPWNADSALAILTRHLNEDCPDPRKIVPEISEASIALLRRMTDRDRTNRARPEEVIQLADHLLAGTALTLVGAPGAPVALPNAKRAGAVATRSSGRTSTLETAKTAAPSRKTTGLQNTLAGTAAAQLVRPVPPPTKQESKAALFVAFVGCAALAAVTTLAVAHRRKPPIDHVAPTGSSVATTNKPAADANASTAKPEDRPDDRGEDRSEDKAGDERMPEEKGPDDKKADASSDASGSRSPPTGSDAASIDPDTMKSLITTISYASKTAADAPADRLADIKRERDATPAAAPALDATRDLVNQVTEALELIKDRRKDLEARGEIARALVRFGAIANRVNTGTPLDAVVKAEAGAWRDAFANINSATRFVAGNAGFNPTLHKSLAPSLTGPEIQFGKEWDEGFSKQLLPAIRAFESGHWDIAASFAEAAYTQLRTPLVAPLAESAGVIKDFASRLKQDKHLTPLDVWEDSRGQYGSDPTTLPLFLHRFVHIEGDSLKRVQQSDWTFVDGWLVSPLGRPFVPLPRRKGLDLAAFNLQCPASLDFFETDRAIEARIKLVRERGGFELFEVSEAKEPPRERRLQLTPVRLVFPSSGGWRWTDLLERDKDKENRNALDLGEAMAEIEKLGTSTLETQDLVVAGTDGGAGLRLLVGGHEVWTGEDAPRSEIDLRGKHLRVKSIDYCYKRLPPSFSR
jgi:predicted Ser/Thr protein kinase